MKRICISFSRYRDDNLLLKGRFIYASLHGNISYASLETILPILKARLDQYSADLAAAATGDRIAIAQKKQSRKELMSLLNHLGLAVMAEANGDQTMLVSSGYDLAKARESRYITNPGNVILSNGISTGQMISRVKAVKGAKCYVHQFATAFDGEEIIWTSITATSCKYMFENLTPGKQYWVRVAVVGSRNQIAYSSVGTWYAQ
ncbi:MAG: hypothetical protein ACTHOB_17500 [Ginsengibacter sp.]